MSLDHGCQNLDERRGCIQHPNPFKLHPFVAGGFFEFDIEIVQGLNMIADESDRGDQDVPVPFTM